MSYGKHLHSPNSSTQATWDLLLREEKGGRERERRQTTETERQRRQCRSRPCPYAVRHQGALPSSCPHNQYLSYPEHSARSAWPIPTWTPVCAAKGSWKTWQPHTVVEEVNSNIVSSYSATCKSMGCFLHATLVNVLSHKQPKYYNISNCKK